MSLISSADCSQLALLDKGEEREWEGGSFRDLRRDDRIIGLYLGPSIT